MKSSTEQPPVLHVPEFDLPVSALLGEKSRAVLAQQSEEYKQWSKMCSFSSGKDLDVSVNRTCLDQLYAPYLARQKARYQVDIEPKAIKGVYTEVFTPAEGITADNEKRILINLHGGGFSAGARSVGQIESIPIAATGKIRVLSIDYRMATEYKFPAASEDVATVYRELLKEYKPENIGIYGCSAGGVLTAQAVAWFQKESLPKPGAVGMFCAASMYWEEGDSGHVIGAMLSGKAPASYEENPYFNGVLPNDPLAFPSSSDEVMEKFPPSLLITSTRDFALSGVVATHTQLTRLGVEANLYVWEGLAHTFFFDPDLPEAREVYDVVVNFFDKHLQ